MRGPYGADGCTVPFRHARPPSHTVAKHPRRRSAQGLVEPVRREDEQQPAVDGGQQVGLAEVDVVMVPDLAGQGILAGVAAGSTG